MRQSKFGGERSTQVGSETPTDASEPAPAAAAQSRELANAEVDGVARGGVAGASDALPHATAIQASFGRYDVSGIRTRTGGAARAAAAELSANAYARGDRVAFAGPPDLHTAAHEAAHVIQQRDGGASVQLKGTLSAPGDAHERHADAVADAVVAGRSAERLLDARPAGAPGIQREEQNKRRPKNLDARVKRYGDAVAAEAAEDVDAGIAAQESAPVDVRLGVTVLPDPATGVLLIRRPQQLGALADLVVGGRAAAAEGLAEHMRGETWGTVDPIADAGRVVLPGEQVRFTGEASKPLPLVGRGKGKGKYDAIKFKTAVEPLREAASVWEEARAERQKAADGRAISLSLAAIDRKIPFAAYSISVEAPGMAAARPLYIYDFLKSAYDTVVVHGDMLGTNDLELRAAVVEGAKDAGLPALRGTRVLTFQALRADEISAWVDEVDATDIAKVEATVKARLAKEGTGGIETLSAREIAQAKPNRQIQCVRRVIAGLPSGDAKGKTLIETLLQCMTPSTFKTMCSVFVGDGTMNTFGHWVDSDPRLMWIFGDQLMASRIISDRNMMEHDSDGKTKSTPQGCMLWVGKNPTWGGWSRRIDFAGAECTVQIGTRGIFGDLADVGRIVHGTWKENTKGSRDYTMGAIASGMVDFVAEMGIGTLDMLDRPEQIIEGLKLLATKPGVVFDALWNHLGEKWNELMDMAREGNRTGDYTEYYYNCGKWISGLLGAIAGAAGALRASSAVIKGILKLRPRNVAAFLRGLLKRTGRLALRRKSGDSLYAKIRNHPSLMRRITKRSDGLDAAIGRAEPLRAAANEAQEALRLASENGKVTKALQRQARKANRKANSAERVVKVRRAALGRLLSDRGVLSAHHLSPKQMVELCKAFGNPDKTVADLTRMRRRFLVQEVPGEEILTARQIKEHPMLFKEKINSQVKVLDKNMKGKKVKAGGKKAQLSLTRNLEEAGLEGVGTLDPKQLKSLGQRFNQPQTKAVTSAATKLDGKTTEQVTTELQAIAKQMDGFGGRASPGEKAIWDDAARQVRAWIDDGKAFDGYLDPKYDLQQLAKRIEADLTREVLAQARQEYFALRLGLPMKSQGKPTIEQARAAILKSFNDRDVIGIHHGRFGVDDGISHAKFVQDLPDEVALRLANMIQEKQFAQYRAALRQAKVQGLKKTLTAVEDSGKIRQGLGVGTNTNVARARIDIKGLERELTAVSGESSPTGTVGLSKDPIFTTRKIGHDRAHDSEAKILEAVAKKLGKNHDCDGSITLMSERPCCPSCLGVIEQFKRRYPNIRLTVETGL